MLISHFRQSEFGRDTNQVSRVCARRFAIHVDAAIRSWLCESDTPSDYYCSLRKLIDPSQLIPANQPGLAVAKWRTDSQNDGLRLQIFQVVLVEPGLLEAILLSLVLLQCGQPFGDTLLPWGAVDFVAVPRSVVDE
jgi:hypothetical protein